MTAQAVEAAPAVVLVPVGGGTDCPMRTATCGCGEVVWQPDPELVFPGRLRRWLHVDGRAGCVSVLTGEPSGYWAAPRSVFGGAR